MPDTAPASASSRRGIVGLAGLVGVGLLAGLGATAVASAQDDDLAPEPTAATISSPAAADFSSLTNPVEVDKADLERIDAALMSEPVIGDALKDGDAVVLAKAPWTGSGYEAAEEFGAAVRIMFKEPIELPADLPGVAPVGEDGVAEVGKTHAEDGRPLTVSYADGELKSVSVLSVLIDYRTNTIFAVTPLA